MKIPLNVFVVDDEEMFRSGIQLVIDSEPDLKVIGSAANGLEAVQSIESIEESQPDVVLLDIQMPVMNGIECLKIIKSAYPRLPVILLTTFEDEEHIIEGLAYGANGYLGKSVDFQTLLQTIRDVVNGRFVLPIEIAAKVSKYLLNSKTPPPKSTFYAYIAQKRLTRREEEIIELLQNRYTNKEIAERLFLSEGTVRNHLTTIYEKMQVNNRREAIKLISRLKQ